MAKRDNNVCYKNLSFTCFGTVSVTYYWEKGQRGVYHRCFRPIGGIGKARLLNVPTLAPNYLKFNYDALSRHPQHMPSTQPVWIFEHCIGATGAAMQEDPTFDPNLGSYAPVNQLNV